MYERKNCFNNYDSFNCFRFLASVTLKTLTEKEFMIVVAIFHKKIYNSDTNNNRRKQLDYTLYFVETVISIEINNFLIEI